jgi:hypothetical protein
LVVSLDVFLILAVLFLRARSGASSRTVPNAHP